MGGQRFVCGNIGMRMCTAANERGIACVIAAALAFYTPGRQLFMPGDKIICFNAFAAMLKCRLVFSTRHILRLGTCSMRGIEKTSPDLMEDRAKRSGIKPIPRLFFTMGII